MPAKAWEPSGQGKFCRVLHEREKLHQAGLICVGQCCLSAFLQSVWCWIASQYCFWKQPPMVSVRSYISGEGNSARCRLRLGPPYGWRMPRPSGPRLGLVPCQTRMPCPTPLSTLSPSAAQHPPLRPGHPRMSVLSPGDDHDGQVWSFNRHRWLCWINVHRGIASKGPHI